MARIYSLLVLSMIIFLSACKTENNESAVFADLESKVEADPNQTNIDNLLASYNKFLQENPDDALVTMPVIQKAYDLTSKNKRPEAPKYLTALIRNSDPGSQKVSDWLYELGSRLEALNKQDAANVIYGNLLKRFPSYPKAEELKQKIGDATPEEIISKLTASRLENPDNYGINKAEAFKYVDACEAYALSAPEDPKSPKFLFDAAEIAKLLRTYPKALSLYDWLIKDYPNYSKTPSALFIKAFTLENELNNQEEARKAYELFLEKYPNDDFADDAKFSLENLGKSPDEVLKEIEAKSQNQ